jgi:hypothetical protein
VLTPSYHAGFDPSRPVSVSVQMMVQVPVEDTSVMSVSVQMMVQVPVEDTSVMSVSVPIVAQVPISDESSRTLLQGP